jgi:pyruvate/2-oxoglutarate dehydrogenase complex dihydrolipoamide acyltransferase (E2) component
VPTSSERYETRPFLKIRRAYQHVYEAGRRKNIIHGLIEIDVTDARRKLAELEAAGEELSFSGFVMHAAARAVQADPIMHAYRRRNRLVLFDDVDVNMRVEIELAGQKIVKSVIVRAANRKTLEEISKEIRTAQGDEPAHDRRFAASQAFSTFRDRFAGWCGERSWPTLGGSSGTAARSA